jgi:peptidoglycan/LPS O-acetylase OafA/YrhL
LTPDAGPKAPPGNPYFPLTDSLRAIGVVGVVAGHVSPVAIGREWWGTVLWNGQMWVVMFFMLSGFLLYRPYLTARAAGRPMPSTRKFLRRRALRILPGYWAALTLLAIWPGLPGVFSGDWWRYYGFLQIYPIGSAGQGLGVAWTLCIELTFYLVLPLFAALMWRRASRDAGRRWMRRQALALATLGLISFAVRAAVWFGPVPSWTVGTLLGQFDYFAIGMGLALISVAVAHSDRDFWSVSLIDRLPGMFIALSVAVYLCICHFAPKPVPNVPALHLVMRPVSFRHEEATYWLSAVAAVLLMVPVIFGDQRRGLSRRILGARPIIGLGVVSYGVYLYHDPVLGQISHFVGTHPWTWVSGTAVPALFFPTLAVSIPLAVLSYRYVELPFLRRRYTSTTPGPGHSGRPLVAGHRLSLRRRRSTPAEETADL